MALRKNNQKDYANFSQTDSDVLGNKKDNDPPKVAGEATGKVSTDNKGMKYAISGEGSPNWENYAGHTVAKGDTIIPTPSSLLSSLPKSHPAHASEGDDDYIMGGDYDLTETEDSKKRSSGPRTYKINK